MSEILDKSTMLEAADQSTIYDAVEVGYDIMAELDVAFLVIGDDGSFIEGDDGGIISGDY